MSRRVSCFRFSLIYLVSLWAFSWIFACLARRGCPFRRCVDNIEWEMRAKRIKNRRERLWREHEVLVSSWRLFQRRKFSPRFVRFVSLDGSFFFLFCRILVAYFNVFIDVNRGHETTDSSSLLRFRHKPVRGLFF